MINTLHMGALTVAVQSRNQALQCHAVVVQYKSVLRAVVIRPQLTAALQQPEMISGCMHHSEAVCLLPAFDFNGNGQPTSRRLFHENINHVYPHLPSKFPVCLKHVLC